MGAKSAAEVIAEREQRMREDPAYREAVEQVQAERAERLRLLRIAEQPVLKDLRDLGLDLDTVWDLYKFPDARPKAIPVLLKHLALDYPDRILEGIAQGLDDRSARAWWGDLREMMLTTDREVVRDRLANALSDCATREHYDDLVTFIQDERLGSSRIYFLRPINRIGNRTSAGRGRAVIQAVANDPVLGQEATAILKGRSRNQ